DKKIALGVHSAPTWGSADSIIYYSKKPAISDLKGYRYYDLYAYDIKEDKEARLTRSARALSPVYIKSLNSIAYIAMDSGKQNIFLYSLDLEKSEKIKVFDDTRILHNLFYDENEKRLLFDYTNHHFRSIAALSLNDYNISDIISTINNDERDVCITDSDKLIFSTDIGGIYNIVEQDTAGIIKILRVL
ncbi:MAG: hypothetical protein GWP19_15290, partial [Planctomycetia bacterium]|nr:hypothetical protein [Planctomycetia bacterium]